MTIYLDSDNNYFLGDASFDTVNNQVNSNVDGSIAIDVLQRYLVGSGLRVNMFAAKQMLSTNIIFGGTTTYSIFCLGAKDDIIDKRFLWYQSNSSTSSIQFYNDSGSPASFITPSSTNRSTTLGNALSAVNTMSTNVRSIGIDVPGNSKFLGVSDGNTLGIIISQPRSSGAVSFSQSNYLWTYVGLLENHNSTYLGSNIVNRYILLNSVFADGTPHSSGMYNLNTEPSGQYIVCGSVVTPSNGVVQIAQNIESYYPFENSGYTQWATDFVAYDTSGNLLGTVRNLKIANGIYAPLRPIKLTNYTGAGNNTWIPVGNLGGKTVLMRCYSSEVLDEDVTLVPFVDVLNPYFCSMDMSSYYSF